MPVPNLLDLSVSYGRPTLASRDRKTLWWCQPPFKLIKLESLTSLIKLTHLSIDANQLLELIHREPDIDISDLLKNLTWSPPPRPNSPLFHNVTHLDVQLFEWTESFCATNFTTLAYQLPKLTHLAYRLSVWVLINEFLWKLSLEKFKKPEVLVWWKDSGVSRKDLDAMPPDKRIVLVSMIMEKYWGTGVGGNGLGCLQIAFWWGGRMRERLEACNLGLSKLDPKFVCFPFSAVQAYVVLHLDET